MSLYNALFGVNPWAGLCLQALNISVADIPRFRDAFIDEGTGDIVIYTRTGGGNRPYYENAESYRQNWGDGPDDPPPEGPWNEDLRQVPGYKRDLDDGFDSTYAYFYFEPSPEWKPILQTAKELGQSPDPRKQWETLLADLQQGGNPQTPEGKRALEVGKQIFDKINSVLDEGTIQSDEREQT